MDELKDELTNSAPSLGKSASDVAEDLQTCAKDAWDSVQRQTNRAARESASYVRANPVPAALAAFGLGLVLGLCLNRREPVSFTERYVAEPLHQSRGMMLGLLLAGGTLLRRILSSTSNAAEEIAETVGGNLRESMKPLKRATRQTGRKIGL